MQQDLINKLYSIVCNDSIADFRCNRELFSEFYRNFLNVSYVDEKSFTIIKAILNNQKLFENEYLISDILDSLKFIQEKNCWKVSQCKDTSLDDLDLILFELNKYLEIKKIVTNPNYIVKVKNSINKASMNSYSNSQIYVYYIDALMIILSTNYLTLSKDKTDEIMSMIYRTDWFNELLEGKIPNSILNRDLIYKYIQRVLSIKEFVSSENIFEDKLVKSIINYKIKDQKLLENIILYFSPTKLMIIFEDKFDKLIEFIINADYLDDQYKCSLIAIIINKFADENNCEYLLDLLQSEIINNSLVSIIVDNKTKTEIINLAKSKSVTDWKYVYYLLDSGVLDKNFISNSMSLHGAIKGKVKIVATDSGLLIDDDYEIKIDQSESDESKLVKMEVYNLTGQILDYNIAIDLLKKYFNGQLLLTIEATKAIIRSIVIEELHKSGIKNVGILFDNSKTANGFFLDTAEGTYISINGKLLENFLNSNAKIEDRLDIFITLFHEIRHAQKHNNISNNEFDYDSYFILKEILIRDYDSNYYHSNYRLILEEIDARQDSYSATLVFCRKYFPELESIVLKIMQEKQEKYDYSEYKEKNFSITNKKELVNLIFDKIISLHPELLEIYPVLQLEYHLDGSPKKEDEITSLGCYDGDLLNQIIQIRLSENTNQSTAYSQNVL